MAPMCFSDLGLGVATCADVSEGDLLGVLVLVRTGFLASIVTSVVSNANVVFLHVRGRNAIDPFAGGLFLGVVAAAAVTGSAAATIAFVGSVGSV